MRPTWTTIAAAKPSLDIGSETEVSYCEISYLIQGRRHEHLRGAGEICIRRLHHEVSSSLAGGTRDGVSGCKVLEVSPKSSCYKFDPHPAVGKATLVVRSCWKWTGCKLQCDQISEPRIVTMKLSTLASITCSGCLHASESANMAFQTAAYPSLAQSVLHNWAGAVTVI